MTASPSELDKLGELLKKFRFAMLTTRTAEDKLTAHPLTVQEAEFDGDLWFIIGKDASAVEDIARNPSVGVSFSSNDSWVSLAGTAIVVDDLAKLFSGASTAFGAEPNSNVAFVDAAMPGMLPVINEYCVEQAVRTGLGLRARINQSR